MVGESSEMRDKERFANNARWKPSPLLDWADAATSTGQLIHWPTRYHPPPRGGPVVSAGGGASFVEWG
jgi:hypothetical protein